MKKTCDCDPQKFKEYRLKNGDFIHMPIRGGDSPHVFSVKTGTKKDITMAEAFKLK